MHGDIEQWWFVEVISDCGCGLLDVWKRDEERERKRGDRKGEKRRDRKSKINNEREREREKGRKKWEGTGKER